MKKNFLLLLLMTLLPLAGWSENIAVQLSTSLQKVYGSADPTTLQPTQFVIISDGGTGVTEADIAQYLTFKRKPGSTGESVGTYDWEVTVSDAWTGAPIVPTNTGRISITPLDLSTVSDLSVTYTGGPFIYDGNEKKPTVTDVTADGSNLDPSDYTISYEDNIDAGTAKIIITAASDNVKESNFKTFTIAQRSLAQNDLTIDDIPSVPFNANYWKPELNIKYGEVALEKGTDYTVAYTNNSNPGTATATVTLQGNYQNDGDITKNFTITKYDLSNDADYASKIQVTGYSGLVYDGKAKTPAVTVKLNGVTYSNAYVSRSWDNNINATTENSKATLTLTGAAGAFKGTKVIEVEIAPKNLEDVTINDIIPVTYDGEAKKPELTVWFNNGSEDVNLEKDEDYTVSYENNTDAGTATVKITAVEGKNYRGSAEKTFTIKPVTVYIKPVDQSKFYGQADPNFAQPTTAMYELVDGEGNKVEKAVLNGTVALGRKAGETVGTYDIYVKSYTKNAEVNDNYSPSNAYYENDANLGSHTATFTIKAQEAKLILKFKEGTPATKVYGDPTYAYSVNDLEVVSGLAGSDTWEDLKDLATFNATLASENVHVDGGNKVIATITGLANYPNIEVQPLAFTVTKRPIGIKPIDQNIDYGKAINQGGGYWVKAAASSFAFTEVKKDVLVELYTDEDVATFAPGSVHEDVIKARIADESNYELDEENSAWGTLTINAATELALNSDDADYDKINAFDGKTVDVTIDFTARNGRELPVGTAREWKANTWNTLVLPFDISVAELSQKLGYAIVNVIDPGRTEISGTSSKFYGKLTMKGGNGYVDPADAKKNDTKLAANKPFMVKTADAITGVIDFGTQTIVAPENAADYTVDAGKGAKFIGTYTTKEVTGNDNANIWFMVGNSDQWLYIGAGKSHVWNILPFEGFIDMENADPAAARNMTFYFEELDGSVTAIKSISVDNVDSKQGAKGFYNLNGMKMDGAPVKKGIYIKDGKKVVIK